MYDPIEINRLLVFGTSNPSSDGYNKYIYYFLNDCNIGELNR